MAPAEPRTSPGKTNGQYRSGESPNASRIVPGMIMLCPSRMRTFRDTWFPSGLEKLMRVAEIPIGILHNGSVLRDVR